MKRDSKRPSGFYWVRFEGSVIVAEYTADGIGCSPEGPHWHVPQSDGCHLDKEVSELLGGRLDLPSDPKRAFPGNPALAVLAGYVWTRELKTLPNPAFNHYRYSLVIPLKELTYVGWRFEVHVQFSSTDETDTAWKLDWLARKAHDNLADAKNSAIREQLNSWQRSRRQADISIEILTELLNQASCVLCEHLQPTTPAAALGEAATEPKAGSTRRAE